MLSIWERLTEELDKARKAARNRTKAVQPNADEIRNGWTSETLTEYVAQRSAAGTLVMDPKSLHRTRSHQPRWQKSKFNPFRCWG